MWLIIVIFVFIVVCGIFCSNYEYNKKHILEQSKEDKNNESNVVSLNIRDSIAKVASEKCNIFYNEAKKGLNDFNLTNTESSHSYYEQGLTFEHAIKYNKNVYTSFGNHKFPRKIAAQMLDTHGQLKPFYKFYKDVELFIEGYDRDLLEREYDMAIHRAHLAVDWYTFKRDKDVLPNIQWVKSINPNGCKNHEKYWNRIWKIDDPFWKQNSPADCLDC